MLARDDYNYKPWREYYENTGDIDLWSLLNKQYYDIFKESDNNNLFQSIEKKINEDLNKNLMIFPFPKLLFNCFIDLDKINVIFIGQDPYINYYKYKNKIIPEAMGISFSVPKGIQIPKTLNNIFNNMTKFNIIPYKPSHGNLENWKYQGCLLLNSALTVINGTSNSHQDIWKPVTDYLINYIVKNTENIIYVLWGKDAYEKFNLITQNETNKVIISSHPSGLSCNKPFRQFSSFNDQNHFGLINKFLKEFNKDTIIW